MCSPSENFHCLQDEFGRIGWLCTEPIWVEKGRCPVYNSGAKKLDTISCNTTNCPLENYRSNYLYIKNGCRFNIEETEKTRIINSTVSTDTSDSQTVQFEYFAIIPVALILFLTAILLILYIRRRRTCCSKKIPTLDHNEGQNIDVSVEKDTLIADNFSRKIQTSEHDRVKKNNEILSETFSILGNTSRQLQTSEHDGGEDINVHYERHYNQR
ncbi:uncharacterized protein LOC134255521 isoform X2 [Saccostrea cucullata]|uniref:uncharacterized protein LOC134255521 isoform X2 n=1 Tax=Saccostrea cuccullata TaxID=36930 RepID=UPI002ED431E6